MPNKIKASWQLICNELESIETNDPEIFSDQILYSVNRQLRELEAIQTKTGLLIEQMKHVQGWFQGVENE